MNAESTCSNAYPMIHRLYVGILKLSRRIFYKIRLWLLAKSSRQPAVFTIYFSCATASICSAHSVASLSAVLYASEPVTSVCLLF